MSLSSSGKAPASFCRSSRLTSGSSKQYQSFVDKFCLHGWRCEKDILRLQHSALSSRPHCRHWQDLHRHVVNTCIIVANRKAKPCTWAERLPYPSKNGSLKSAQACNALCNANSTAPCAHDLRLELLVSMSEFLQCPYVQDRLASTRTHLSLTSVTQATFVRRIERHPRRPLFRASQLAMLARAT
jgi:hypothetical protein